MSLKPIIGGSGFYNSGGGASLPTSSVVPFAGAVIPSGWLQCTGAAVSRATYAALFAAVGVTYGGGDGETTFNLPDMRGRVAAGLDVVVDGSLANRLTGSPSGFGANAQILAMSGGFESVSLDITQIPAHTHTYEKPQTIQVDAPLVPAVSVSSGTFDSPATGSAGDTMAHVNVQPTIILNYIIKT